MKNFFITLYYKKGRINLISKTLTLTAAAIFVCFCTGRSVMSQDFYVYPSKGQTAEETNRDKFECHEWAKQQTGIDPHRVATAVQPKQVEQRGGLFRGAARGATLGVIGGAIGGDAGKGAAIGAVTGAIFGGVERAQRQEEEAEWQRQHQSMQNYQMQEQHNYAAQAKGQYDFVLKACLENRGYTVK